MVKVNSFGLSILTKKQRRSGKLALEKALDFAPVGILLLFVPAWVSVTQANALADHLYDLVESLLRPLVSWFNKLPEPLAATNGRRLRSICNVPLSTPIRTANNPNIYRINCHLQEHRANGPTFL